jgi:hypothetical protein
MATMIDTITKIILKKYSGLAVRLDSKIFQFICYNRYNHITLVLNYPYHSLPAGNIFYKLNPSVQKDELPKTRETNQRI